MSNDQNTSKSQVTSFYLKMQLWLGEKIPNSMIKCHKHPQPNYFIKCHESFFYLEVPISRNCDYILQFLCWIYLFSRIQMTSPGGVWVVWLEEGSFTSSALRETYGKKQPILRLSRVQMAEVEESFCFFLLPEQNSQVRVHRALQSWGDNMEKKAWQTRDSLSHSSLSLYGGAVVTPYNKKREHKTASVNAPCLFKAKKTRGKAAKSLLKAF